MSTTNHQALSLLQQAFDALEVTADSDIDTFEDEEEEAEAVPAQYVYRLGVYKVYTVPDSRVVAALAIYEQGETHDKT